MSTPELKPETPLTDAMVAAYRKEGLETYASTCAAIALARSLESALNAAREAIEYALSSATPHPIQHPTMYDAWGEMRSALAQINKALSPQQSKTT